MKTVVGGLLGCKLKSAKRIIELSDECCQEECTVKLSGKFCDEEGIVKLTGKFW